MTEKEKIKNILARVGFGVEGATIAADALLENGVIVPPCKVGDTVYIPYDECNGYGCPYMGDYGNWRCKYKGQDRCKPFIDERPFELSMLNDLGKTVFLSREAAEKALKGVRNDS